MKKITILLLSIALYNCQTTPEIKDASVTVVKQKYSRPEQPYQLNIPYRRLDTEKVVTKFGFGSCNDQNKPQPLWKKINDKQFDLFLMMGDNVYASSPADKPIIDQYIKLNSNKDYQDLREKTPFLATWDDHDFGQNDGGFDNPEKLEAQKLFVNYWSYTKNNIPPTQNGIYNSQILGNKKQRVQFIMLDTRFDRSALIKNENPDPASKIPRLYLPDTSEKSHIFSSEQWKWLEAELKKPAELRFIISSIQFIANDHAFEKWGNFPLEQQKMIQLLEKNKLKNVIFLSGDRHLSAIAKQKIKTGDLFDVTSSGLNRPSRATEPEIDQLYNAPSYLKINFGQAEIDWAKKHVVISIIGEDGSAPLTQTIGF